MDDQPVDDATKKAVLGALNAIDINGSFAGFNAIHDFVDPTITLDPHGPIKLPLLDVDASRIIAASHQAPFGKGEQTIVDTEVRNTWELNRDQFAIQNSEFAKVVDECLLTASRQLGIDGIDAELYKLLLYEKGALFKSHTDTEKVPGMFGTLVICLPSQHEGGNIVLKHNRRKRTFSTEKSQPSCACWYSDVRHEVKKVTSGHRLVLTYNLVRNDGAPTAAPANREYPALRSALSQWLQQSSTMEHQPLIHILEHKYTDASLKLKNLKAGDFTKARVLQRLAQELGFVVYLASMEREVYGECTNYYSKNRNKYDRWGWNDEEKEAASDDSGPHSIEEEDYNVTLKLKRIVDTEGTKLLTDLRVSEENIVQEDPFGDRRAPDDEDFQGYTGNEGAYATHWYRDTVLVLVNQSDIIDFLLSTFAENNGYSERRTDIGPLLMTWSEKHRSSESACEKVVGELKAICNLITTRNHKGIGCFPDDIIDRVFSVFASLDDMQGLLAAAQSAEGYPTIRSMSSQTALMADSAARFIEIKPVLEAIVAKCTGAWQRYDAVDNILDNIRSIKGPSAEAKLWADEVLRAACLDTEMTNANDGIGLSKIALFLDDEDAVTEVIVPAVLQNQRHSRFTMSFILAWLTSGCTKYSTEAVSKSMETIWPSARSYFGLQAPEIEETPTWDRQAGTGPAPETGVIDEADDAFVLAGILNFLMRDQDSRAQGQMLSPPQAMCFAEQLLTLLNREAMKGDTGVISQTLLPVLLQIQYATTQHLTGPTGSLIKSTYFTVLNQYLRHYVREKPRRPSSLHSNRSYRYRWAPSRRHGYDSANSAWEARFQRAATEFAKFDQNFLKGVLGKDYDEIFNLRAVNSGTVSSPGSPVQKTVGTVHDPPASTAGVKRKNSGVDRKAGPLPAKRKSAAVKFERCAS